MLIKKIICVKITQIKNVAYICLVKTTEIMKIINLLVLMLFGVTGYTSDFNYKNSTEFSSHDYLYKKSDA